MQFSRNLSIGFSLVTRARTYRARAFGSASHLNKKDERKRVHANDAHKGSSVATSHSRSAVSSSINMKTNLD